MERKSAVGELERDALLRLESGKLETCSMGRPNSTFLFGTTLVLGDFPSARLLPGVLLVLLHVGVAPALIYLQVMTRGGVFRALRRAMLATILPKIAHGL